MAGHPDNCGCEECNSHEEYCDFCGESLAHCKCRMPDADNVKRVYELINLDCPICASKIEHKIKSLPGVDYATVSYSTKQLRVSAKNPDAMLPIFQEICRSFLSYVTVVPRDEGPGQSDKFRTYNVSGLDCAACSIKVQDAVAAIPGVQMATLVYETGQLRVTADDYDGLLPKMQAAAEKAEDGVTITERVRASAQKKYRTYKVDGLDCAACSVKVQDAIAALPIVDEAILVYETGQLRVSARSYDGLLPQMQAAADKAEEGVTISEKEQFGAAKFRTYDVQGLDCAACATKVEDAIKAMAEVEDAVLVYATGQLRVTAKSYDGLTAKMQAVTDKVEDGVTIVEREDNAPVPERKKEKSFLSENAREIFELVVGGAIFIVTEWLGLVPEQYHMYCLVVAYVILGWKIVLTALKNLTKGEFFDENFLMTVATLGAFAIQAWEEAVGVIFFYRVGEWFQDRAADRSRDQIMDAVDMRPEVVNLLVGEDVKVIPSAEARVGDILLVRVGDRIPLDGVVIDGESLLDTSPVTGEPVPVRKSYGDEVLSGCVNTSGMLKIRVEKELQESMVTKILDSVENAAANKPYIDKFITRFARVYTPIVVALALIVAIVPSLMTGEWNKWIYTALTFLVISCPCALVLSVPLSFFAGIGAGSKLGILFKGGNAMEMLKNVAAVVMDKTGTVTKGNFVVQEVLPAGGANENELLRVTAGAEQVSTHPIAVSIVSAAKERNLDMERPDRFEEIAGAGLVAYSGNNTLLVGNPRLMDQFKIDYSAYQRAEYGSEVLVAKNGTYLGSLRINDTLKDDAKQAVADITKLGLSTVMLTGDARREAEAVAKEAGISEVRAELLPQDKLKEMNDLRNKYGGVMFVGDGINDA
ncbi:MAG: cadmium-translocating P-type ATPase, partial [Schwartzia sp.]|nr:cadmium-translocating P-type ATPase [Schwartzia sp. (in: firmicutes)]